MGPGGGKLSKRRTLLAAIVLSSLLSVAIIPALAVANETPPVGVQSPPATTEIFVESEHLGTISKYLFGANLLWADNAEGAFDPQTDSFYPTFVSMLRRLDVSILRYPGGTTSDSFPPLIRATTRRTRPTPSTTRPRRSRWTMA